MTDASIHTINQIYSHLMTLNRRYSLAVRLYLYNHPDFKSSCAKGDTKEIWMSETDLVRPVDEVIAVFCHEYAHILLAHWCLGITYQKKVQYINHYAELMADSHIRLLGGIPELTIDNLMLSYKDCVHLMHISFHSHPSLNQRIRNIMYNQVTI